MTAPLLVADPVLMAHARAARIAALPWAETREGPTDPAGIARRAQDAEVIFVTLSGSWAELAEKLAAKVAEELDRSVLLRRLDYAEDLASAVERGLEQGAERVQPPPKPLGREAYSLGWEPYPIDALPRSLRDLAREGADAIGCDPSFVALPTLVVCAGAIGLSRAARIRPGWCEPSVLWGCIVGDSGSRKSPALDLAEAPLAELEGAARRAHQRDLRAWEEECDVLRSQASKRTKPRLPPPPIAKRLLVKDATIEVLPRILTDNPRGVTDTRDELATWFRSWGEYKAHASGDAAKWLEIHGARALIVDRVTEGRSHYVARAAVSVVGGTQPRTLRRVLSPEHVESGCAARILFAFPPSRARKWTEAEVSPASRTSYEHTVRALVELAARVAVHEDGETGIAPLEIPLSNEARDLFARWVEELGAEALGAREAAAAAASKLEGGAARLALVVQLASAAECASAADVTEIGAEAMAAGIRLARWHWREARRVLCTVAPEEESEEPEERERRRLLEWIEQRGGSTTERELARGPACYRARGRAREALQALIGLGLGEWRFDRPPEGGGHSVRRFVLARHSRPSDTCDGDGRSSDGPLSAASVAVALSREAAGKISAAVVEHEEEAAWTL